MKINTTPPDDKGYRFPPEIISHAVWLSFRFLLSFSRCLLTPMYNWLFQLFGEPLGTCSPLLIQLSLDMRPSGVLREGLNSAPSSCLNHIPI